MQAQGDITGTAMKAALAVAHAILGNTPTVSHLLGSAKAAKLESLDGRKAYPKPSWSTTWMEPPTKLPISQMLST